MSQCNVIMHQANSNYSVPTGNSIIIIFVEDVQKCHSPNLIGLGKGSVEKSRLLLGISPISRPCPMDFCFPFLIRVSFSSCFFLSLSLLLGSLAAFFFLQISSFCLYSFGLDFRHDNLNHNNMCVSVKGV